MTMRQTTCLLMAHLPEVLARLAESYIIDRRSPIQLTFAGHWELVSELPGKDLRFALNGACFAGDILMIRELIGRGANTYTSGLRCALAFGMIEAAELMYSFGAICPAANCVGVASNIGQMRVLEWAIKRKCAACPRPNFNRIMRSGAANKNFAMVAYAIGNGAADWNRGLRAACIGGDRGIILLMLHLGGRPSSGLRGACYSGKLTLANEMIRRGATDFNAGLKSAACGGRTYVMALMLNRGATSVNSALNAACEEKMHVSIKWLAEHGATKCYCGMTIADHLATASTSLLANAHAHDA